MYTSTLVFAEWLVVLLDQHWVLVSTVRNLVRAETGNGSEGMVKSKASRK